MILSIGVLALLAITYFMPITIDGGANYVVTDRLLGIIVFHNAFILCIYVVIAAISIAAGIKFNSNKMKGGKK